MDFIDLKAQYARIKTGVDSRIKAVFEHGQFIMGPEVTQLEAGLGAYIGSKHAITCASGTDALLLALMALGVKPGDEVITTPFTFIATAEMVALVGAIPVFVDIDPVTYNIDPAKIQRAITPRTKAIIPVSLYGQCADMETINKIAAGRGLPVIEDGAQSFGAMRHGKKSLALSTIGCASFFPSKPLACYGDGGACFTDDEALATKMRQIRVHGQDRRYNHPLIGVNARLDTLQAAILLEKLAIFPDEVKERDRLGRRYTQALSGAVTTPSVAPGNTHVWAQYTIEVDNRDQFQTQLNAKGIPTAVHYPKPLHLQPAFAYLNHKPGSFPVAEKAAERVVSLPMSAYLKESDMDLVVKATCDAVKGAA